MMTLTRLPDFMGATPIEVPHAITSPGSAGVRWPVA
jgi:hypothetical protein